MGDALDDVLPLEWRPSSRKVEWCGICKPPEDVGMNHPPLPRGVPPLTDMGKFTITGYDANGATRRRSR